MNALLSFAFGVALTTLVFCEDVAIRRRRRRRAVANLGRGWRP